MNKRVQVLGFVNEDSNELKAKYETDLIRYSIHIEGRQGYIKSYEVALLQLDDRTLRIVNTNLIKSKK